MFFCSGKIYNRMARVEHVDHARKSAQHCVKSLLTAYTEPYACCYLYSSFDFVKRRENEKPLYLKICKNLHRFLVFANKQPGQQLI